MMRTILRPILNPILGEASVQSEPAPLPNGSSTVVARGSNYFNGTTDYYQYSDAANLDLPNGDWTIGALMKVTNTNNALYQHIYAHGNSGSNNHVRLWLGGNKIGGSYTDGAGNSGFLFNGAALTPNFATGWYVVGMRRRETAIEGFACPVLGSSVSVGTTNSVGS